MPIKTCPKCSYIRQASDGHIHEGICPACGIAIQKFLDRQRGITPVEMPPLACEVIVPRAQRIRARLMEPPPKLDPVTLGARAVVLVAACLWGLYFTWHGISFEALGGSFLHQAMLPFHEFGHVLFMPFGRFMTILGGSLFQVAMPLGLAAAFIYKQRDTFGASMMVWWSGQSMLDLSVYIADAKDRALPLIGGGGEEGHDWGNLLTMMGLLDWTVFLARLCFCAGVLTMLAAIVWGAILLRDQRALLREPG